MKFSVIIPVYNAELYIDRCLLSIRKAIKLAKSECEVICVDDGSSDKSWSVLQNYSLPELKLVRHKKNLGVSAARNTALGIARGEWILFVDADDYVSEDYFMSLESSIDNNPRAQIVCFGSNSPFGDYKFASLWSKAYRKDVLPDGGFDDFSHGEDRLFLLKAILKAKTIVSIPDVLYTYAPHSNGLTLAPRTRKWVLDTIGVSRQMLDVAIESGKVLPSRFFRDIALWILEECVIVKDGLAKCDKKHVEKEWKNILKYISLIKQIPYWHRLVANMCYCLGGAAEFTLCKIPRWVKKGF